VSVTAELIAEHRIIDRMVEVIDHLAREIGAGRSVAGEELRQVLDFIENFADRCHHAKEDETLFPLLAERGVPDEKGGPIGTMSSEHERSRALTREIAANLELYDSGDTGAAKVIADSAAAYARLLRPHLDKEEEVLFAIAEEVLTDEDTAKLVVAFAQLEEEHLGPDGKDRYIELVEELESRYLL